MLGTDNFSVNQKAVQSAD